MYHLIVSVIYNYTYGHATLTSEIVLIRNSCTPSSVLCIGGIDSATDWNNLLTIACGNCLFITSCETQLHSPVLHNQVYWYFTPHYSFGFSPNSTINQYQADSYDQDSKQRISWHLDLQTGGWRLGSITWLNSDTRYYKILLLL